MRRRVSTLVCLLAALTLAACTSGPVNPAPTPTVTPQPGTTPTPPAAQPVVPMTLALNIGPQPVPQNVETAFSAIVMVGTAPTDPCAWAWDYGDGQRWTGPASISHHAYPTPGTYAASVTLTDATGRTATATARIVVTAVLPTPPPTPTPAPTLALTIGCTPGTHATTATQCNLAAAIGSTQLTSQIVSVAWDWGDGFTQSVLSSPLGARVYAQSGNYVVVVKATMSDGQTASTNTSVTVP